MISIHWDIDFFYFSHYVHNLNIFFICVFPVVVMKSQCLQGGSLGNTNNNRLKNKTEGGYNHMISLYWDTDLLTGKPLYVQYETVLSMSIQW